MPSTAVKNLIMFGGGGYAFSQSLGAELLTDGGLEDWASATNLTNWTKTIAGASTINREASVVHSGSFAARYDIDGSNTGVFIGQVVAGEIGDIFEISFWACSNPTGKQLKSAVDSNANVIHTVTNAYQQFYEIGRAGNTNPSLIFQRQTATSASLYYDEISCKKITPSNQQAAVADGTIDFMFTLPASPVIGQQIHRRYRCAAATPTIDYWDLYLKRNDANNAWELFVDSVASGVTTSRKGATAVSANPTGLRVVLSGALHDHYTYESSTWTIRGAQVNNATHQTNTIINTVYNTGFTPVSSVWA